MLRSDGSVRERARYAHVWGIKLAAVDARRLELCWRLTETAQRTTATCVRTASTTAIISVPTTPTCAIGC